ncbi:SOS-response repressor and protease LexA [hydrothermal vent metagenome]|uniref:SOS-response repressor and protease LexA n=1 Tax=hydrothermal vent metagenome TaxID=652676 RepID=A0A3B1B7E6_9ZZZZ
MLTPSLSEVAEGIGIRSKGVAHRYVQALAEAGALILHPGQHRGIELVEDALSIPLLGRIAAGQPIEAIPGQDQLDLSTLYGPNRYYALRVTGDSMVDAGILDGDTVIIEQRDIANDGEIVVALIDGENATLKRLKYRQDGSLALIAENTTMPPMIYAAERVVIQGIVVGQLRWYR